MSVILVGHGSIGSRYKASLLKRGINKNDIKIIDPNKNVKRKLNEEGFKCFESLESLRYLEDKLKFGIVANWGPEHLSTATKLIEIGCKRLIIEKPISNSIAELNDFKNKIKDKNIFITVHYHWKFTNLANTIEEIAKELELGDPVGIRIYGGAVGLSTNGTHFFDLACDLLKSDPKTVISDLEIENINPRDKSLIYIGGSAFYKMENNKFINVSFSNKNSQSINAHIIYRHGIIETPNNGNIKCHKRDKISIDKFGKKITRYGLFEENFNFNFNDPFTVDLVLDELFKGKKPSCSLSTAEKSLRMVLGAIQSHIEERKVNLNCISDKGMRIS
jgi:predicted dehydrogenase